MESTIHRFPVYIDIELEAGTDPEEAARMLDTGLEGRMGGFPHGAVVGVKVAANDSDPIRVLTGDEVNELGYVE